MKKYLNNKGYMLVEIILASAIAMAVAYFVIDLSIKLKNKNDDLLVKTLVYTDQSIIYNELGEFLYTSSIYESRNCTDIENYFSISENKFIRRTDNFTHIVSEYAKLGNLTCTQISEKAISIKIPITVKQLPDEDFDVILNYTRPDH